ncbi:hypothetical protein DAEQUDRAFT_768844 [Daedalea quercina L-15889]|uniref:Telomere length regulation protein conserved domain-containing protein n=1 Tax=Daedalea quercina L-15889 TaxID=1314783 RepID=A0A165MBY0_9APHY|nr:hypothetical protein DAEQUDRAFT_768844 [Daedalea quercina L-15889]
MSAGDTDTAIAQIKDAIARLQSPIPDVSTLLRLLAAPLGCIGLLPPAYRKYDVEPLSKDSFNIARHVPPLQRALIEHVLPSWEPTLLEEDCYDLVEQYFCPDSISFASNAAGQMAVLAYSTILASTLHEPAVRLLVKLCRAYPIDALHAVVSSSKGKLKEVTWEDCVRNVAALPVKVANALGPRGEIPPELQFDTYLNNVSLRCERLMFTLSSDSARGDPSSITYLLSKLVNLGLFSASKSALSQPSFFEATLPTIRRRLSDQNDAYAAYWQNILSSFSSSLTLHSILTALFSSMLDVPDRLDIRPGNRALVKREAVLLRGLLGRPTKDRAEILGAVSAIVLSREWNEGHARIFACWFCGAQKDRADTEVLDAILWKVVDMWTDADHIKHSLLSRHRYVTALLLLILASFRSDVGCAAPFQTLAFHPPFITGVSIYISHLDPTVRRCGMLVAEEVARGAGKKLDFDDWTGEQHGRDWCRQMRTLLQARDADADVDRMLDTEDHDRSENADTHDLSTALPAAPLSGPTSGKVVIQDVDYDSDDSLTGYASPAPSSRSASPTPSELAEIEKDPSLNVGRGKVARPVYLAQLGEMVRSTSGLQSDQEDMEAQKIEVALNVAEELIRRKRAFGTELDENAVNLTYGFLGLKDNYDLDGFDEKRQAAMNALVACCPRKAAPALIEQFFRNQYSTNQRFVILNALAVGSAELASLPLLPPSVTVEPKRTSFPSKQLPAALHKKYLTAADRHNANDPIQLLVDDISRKAIDSGKEATANRVPGIIRERHLRIRRPAKVAEVPSGTPANQRPPGGESRPTNMTFTEVAAEFFICPLINRFWLFLRDEQTREERTMHRPALHRYRGAGTGLILNAMVLARFLSTLAVLVHAARNAPEWLAVVAPDALELAVTLGTRPVSAMEGEDEDEDESQGPNGETRKRRGKEAAVLSSALELALIVLDGCMDLDGGRSLGLDHTALLLGAGEWAKEVFSKLDQGERILGEGGEQEIRLRRAAAGLVLKVEELSSRWRRSMVDVGLTL